MVGAGGEQHQQARLGGKINPGGIERMAGRDGAAMAHGQARHQLVGLAMGVEAQAATAARAIAIDVVHGAEVGVGMVVAPHPLAWSTDHGPGALDVDGQLGRIKAQGQQIGPHLLLQLATQPGKGGQPVDLGDAMEVAGPGIAGVGIALLLAPQLQ